MRGIAIYDDKIFVTTGRHLMAFDARNGKVVWDADRSKGEYSNNSGPLAVKAG